jgi:hypothetical protein
MTVAIESLLYAAGSEWAPLPSWGRFLLELGRMLARDEGRGGTPVAALSVPTRAFAAVLIATGAVAGRASIPILETAEERFEQLKSLPIGTPVIWRKKGRVRRGQIAEYRTFSGRQLLMIRVQREGERGGGLAESLYPEQALGVEVADTEVDLPMGQSRGRLIRSVSHFIQGIIPHIDPTLFAIQSRLDAVIVGTTRVLRYEFCEESFAIGLPNGRYLQGTLQEVMRPDGWVGKGEGWRSRIVSDRARTIEDFGSQPGTLVFDGGLPFLRWHHRWGASSVVVILDRADDRSRDAAELINRDYVERRREEEDGPWDELELPDGIEMMAYRVSG